MNVRRNISEAWAKCYQINGKTYAKIATGNFLMGICIAEPNFFIGIGCGIVGFAIAYSGNVGMKNVPAN